MVKNNPYYFCRCKRRFLDTRRFLFDTRKFFLYPEKISKPGIATFFSYQESHLFFTTSFVNLEFRFSFQNLENWNLFFRTFSHSYVCRKCRITFRHSAIVASQPTSPILPNRNLHFVTSQRAPQSAVVERRGRGAKAFYR